MATITLDQDRPISYLISNFGLAANDTIQLTGHSLIIDIDAVDYPVTIANNAGDCNLELRDLGRIKLNATLPVSVHPWIDPVHPLPVSAEPGIDGDPYRTPLTANARAEIQLNGEDHMTWGLGGGTAYLPTHVRDGGFFAKIDSITTGGVIFSPQLPLHVGDMLIAFNGTTTTTDNNRKFVSSIDETTGAVSFTNNNLLEVGQYWGLIAGGVLIEKPSRTSTSATIISAPMYGGCVSIDLNYSGGIYSSIAADSNIKLQRFVCLLTGFIAINHDYNSAFGNNIEADIEQFATCSYVSLNPSKTRIDEGFVNFDKISPVASIFCQNATTRTGVVANTTVLSSGVITDNLFAPATSTTVTWRYANYLVQPNSTLRLNCKWTTDSQTSLASVAITNQAIWWPQLWQLGAKPLAKVEFDSSTPNEQIKMLLYRNTSDEPMQVRVWECVTGNTDGGYLSTKEVRGGPM